MQTNKLYGLGLYFVTDTIITKIPVTEQARQAIKAGVKIIQYREKNLSTLEMYNTAKEIKKLAKGKAIFIINDRVDICLAVDADGVHLGNEDIPYKDARKLLKNKIIGLSTHNLEEALIAEKTGADYISIGPIFPTKTKPDHQKPIGIENLRKISQKIKIPFVAIGGIKESNLKEVLSAGAKNVVMISAVMKDEKIYENIKYFQDKFLVEKSNFF